METIPESRTQMAIPTDSLLKLPAGAVFRSASGRAHTEVQMRGDTIYIAGTCDSLARQVEYYEELYHAARDALGNYRESVEQKQKRGSSPIKSVIALLIVGLAAGAILTHKINKKRNEKG